MRDLATFCARGCSRRAAMALCCCHSVDAPLTGTSTYINIDMEPADLHLVALLGANLRYLDEISERYKVDPGAVDPSFVALLRSNGATGIPAGSTLPAATQEPRSSVPGGAD